jgi:hypothetical protein
METSLTALRERPSFKRINIGLPFQRQETIEPSIERPAEPPLADEDTPPVPRAKKKRSRLRRYFKRFLARAAILVALRELSAVSFIWITPPRTAYILQNGDDIA